jgi:hypothetical protein
MVAKVAIATMNSRTPPPLQLDRDWPIPCKPRFPNDMDPLMSRKSCSKRVRSLGKLPTSSLEDLEHSNRADIVAAALHVVVSGNDSFRSDDIGSEPKSPSMKKEVRFNTAENQVILPCHGGLTEEEIETSWWSHEEYSNSLHKFRVSIQRFYDTQEDAVKKLNRVVSLCNQASSDTSNLEDATARLVIVPECRGMEADLTPALKSSRRRHATIVLEHLQKIPSHLPEEMRERMLSARSMQLSRPHKVFARVLGDADQHWVTTSTLL